MRPMTNQRPWKRTLRHERRGIPKLKRAVVATLEATLQAPDMTWRPDE